MGRLHDDITLAMLYAAADVFVLPSRQENLPNTIMESLACGTPCVAFHVGGISDMIEHQRNGYLARPYEIEDLAYGIEWVLADEKRWQALSQQARQKAEEEFDIERVVRRYVDLYQEIVTRRG
jgi:glycosyltransferase involved in cell wall biosynthesis